MYIVSLFFKNSNQKEKVKMIFLFILLTFSAILDALGVASIFPFLTIISDPDQVRDNIVVSWIYDLFKFKNDNNFFLFMGATVIFLFITGIIVKSIAQFFLLKFIYIKEHLLAQRIFSGYLNQDYISHISENSSNATKTILSEVNQIMVYAFLPMANIIAYSISISAIITLLLLIEPNIALIALSLFSFLYIIIFLFFKPKVKEIGKRRTSANALRYKVVTEAFNGFKELKVMSMETVVEKNFSIPSKSFAESQAHATIIGTLPRYFIEAFAMGLIIIFSLYSMRLNGDFSTGLPLVGVFVLASYRLMPSIQIIYNSYVNLNFASSAIKDLIILFEKLEIPKENITNEKKINFQHSISIKNGSFRYNGDRKVQIENLNYEINKGSFVAFVGETGSGKTTIVDLLVGLLKLNNGKIFVDGIVLNDSNLQSWHQELAYVPQSVFLFDDTILSNIALGIKQEDINFGDVVKAAKFADIHNFIENDLPEKYNTIIGDKGVSLSGGQKQRIGIARAILRDSSVIILDEATSGLDQKTEKSIMKKLQKLANNKTIIIISHRLESLKNCNNLFLIRNGQIIAEGPYDKLIKSNKYFSEMAKL